jgi:hypothetical protein
MGMLKILLVQIMTQEAPHIRNLLPNMEKAHHSVNLEKSRSSTLSRRPRQRPMLTKISGLRAA